MTPFHNVALMCPATTKADAGTHTSVFGAAAAYLHQARREHPPGGSHPRRRARPAVAGSRAKSPSRSHRHVMWPHQGQPGRGGPGAASRSPSRSSSSSSSSSFSSSSSLVVVVVVDEEEEEDTSAVQALSATWTIAARPPRERRRGLGGGRPRCRSYRRGARRLTAGSSSRRDRRWRNCSGRSPALRRTRYGRHAEHLLAAAQRPSAHAPAGPASEEGLSERELEVLRLLATDLTGPEISGRLFMSVNTFRTHTRASQSRRVRFWRRPRRSARVSSTRLAACSCSPLAIACRTASASSPGMYLSQVRRNGVLGLVGSPTRLPCRTARRARNASAKRWW